MESYKGIALSQREATIVSCKVSMSYIILHHVRIALSHASFCLHPLYFCIKFHQLLRIIWRALRQSQHIITVFCFHPVESCAESKQRICIRLSNPLKLIPINAINMSFTTFADMHWGLFSSIVLVTYHLNPTAATKLEQICTLNNPSNLPLDT